MDIRVELENQYDALTRRVFRVGYNHYFTKEEIEDLLQDICVCILEFEVAPGEWGGVITKQLGLSRTQRSRSRDRQVKLPNEVT